MEEQKEPKKQCLETQTSQARPEMPPLIQEQIRLASEKVRSFQDTISEEQRQTILTDLEGGKVPPIFHALAMKKDYNLSKLGYQEGFS